MLTLAIGENALVHNILGVYYLIISAPNKLFRADLLFTIHLATPTGRQGATNEPLSISRVNSVPFNKARVRDREPIDPSFPGAEAPAPSIPLCCDNLLTRRMNARVCDIPVRLIRDSVR